MKSKHVVVLVGLVASKVAYAGVPVGVGVGFSLGNVVGATVGTAIAQATGCRSKPLAAVRCLRSRPSPWLLGSVSSAANKAIDRPPAAARERRAPVPNVCHRWLRAGRG